MCTVLNHCLDLSLQEVAKTVRLVADTLSFVREVGKLIRNSSKRKQTFAENFDDGQPLQLRSLCPTRWSVRASAISRVIETYEELMKTLNEVAQDKGARGDVQARAAGLFKQSKEVRTYFGLLACCKLFESCEAVAKHLQRSDLTAVGLRDSTCIQSLKQTLNAMRSDEAAGTLIEETAAKGQVYGLKAREKRPRSTPARLRHNNKITHEELISETELLKASYFETIDVVVQELSQRFDQEDLHVAVSREESLKGKSTSELENCRLPTTIDMAKLKQQLPQFFDLCDLKKISSRGAIGAAAVLTSLEAVTRSIFSEVEKLVSLILCLPISAASAERSFSSLRRMKTWMRSTMSQRRLTQMAILSVHRDRLQNVDMRKLMKCFISKTPDRCAIFGKM